MEPGNRMDIRRFRRLAAVAGLTVILAGCETPGLSFLTGGPSAALPPAALPTYAAGDTFNYINDRKEPVLRQVVQTQGETVEWKTETPYRFISSRSFFQPRISWDGIKSSGTASRVPDPRVMWPLKKGKRATVKATYNRTDKAKNVTRTYKQAWKCKSYEWQQVTVPAGTFDAIKVICRRLTENGKRSKRMRIWYYAPKIGHFVKRVKKYRRGPDKTLELVSVRKARRR